MFTVFYKLKENKGKETENCKKEEVTVRFFREER
jgi:hypothetical protein